MAGHGSGACRASTRHVIQIAASITTTMTNFIDLLSPYLRPSRGFRTAFENCTLC
jgi:hypothetical protein